MGERAGEIYSRSAVSQGVGTTLVVSLGTEEPAPKDSWEQQGSVREENLSVVQDELEKIRVVPQRMYCLKRWCVFYYWTGLHRILG